MLKRSKILTMFKSLTLIKSGLLWAILLAFVPVTKGFSQQINGTEQNSATIAWPNTPPYRKVGDPRRASWGKAEDVPVPVYKEALRLLGGDPSTWYILNDVNYAGQVSTLF